MNTHSEAIAYILCLIETTIKNPEPQINKIIFNYKLCFALVCLYNYFQLV